jgi:glycosyltransferase involved in cell wall biosynthesis
MRILGVNFLHWSITGGGTALPREVAVRLASRHDIAFATHLTSFERDWLAGPATTFAAPRETTSEREAGVLVHRLGLGPLARILCHPVMLRSQLFALRPAGFRLAFGARLRRLAAAADLVHAFALGRGLFEGVALAAARSARVPFVVTPFAHPSAERIEGRVLAVCRAADAVVALTAAEKAWLVGEGVAAEKIRVIPYGPLLAVPPVPGFLRRRFEGHPPIVLFLGRKTRYKGVDLLLAAAPLVWRERPEVVFVLAGPETGYSRRLLAGVADPRIVVLPELSEAEKAGAFADCDVFCMPSSEESLGGVYLEAWSNACPVVGLDIPAVRELFKDGERGLLASRSAEDIAGKLRRVLGDPALAAELGRRGQEALADEFSWAGVVARTAALYSEVAAGLR